MADYSWPNVSMLEGCGELPLHPPSVAGTFYFGSRMSALGHSRRFDRVRPTSGLPRLTDILRFSGPAKTTEFVPVAPCLRHI
jgi:hypothetical protein